MKKQLVTLILAASLTAGAAVGAFAADDRFTSTDTEVLTQMLTEMTDEEKEIFINENLDVRLQHLSTLATLSSNMDYSDIADEVKAALDDGVTAVEIKEAIYHSAAYCGYTRAAGALDAADAALKALGEDVAYSSRITSTEETRYADGLAVQRTLFGPQIGTITDGMEESLKMQTLYLSGICFGDFYNRTGLSLYTREFLTFCTIVGNGNCEGQLTGHANGNLNVGHSANMLRAAVMLNEKYNGAEKTALALKVINTVDTGETPEAPTEPAGKTETIAANYTSDSEELLGIMEHFKTDDTDNYISGNLDEETQNILVNATEAAINGTDIPSSDNKATQVLINLAVMGAEGGRENEVPDTVAEGMADGVSADTMLAVPLLCTPYNGFPRTLNMRSAIYAAVEAIEAENVSDFTLSMQIGNPTMTVNGEAAAIDEEGTVPVIVNERTLLPVRAVVEAMGGTVDWNDETRTVVLKRGDDSIELVIDSNIAVLNGTESVLDTAPTIINKRTMLPIRFIAEGFGYNVDWDGAASTVTITSSDKK